ncbi:membrane-spanning 4-domains subfamily A member 4A-like [Podarcis raffonei]|uniref:membrane-spanning 4-domains subfamily A member 4A-like n=1 Tax=Podarcis raffonei TaxID=65483 RepID=UPI00232967AC|nr:membrane-spanning 4-domains subfamily A member 4A-like [Podarcis raffonei]
MDPGGSRTIISTQIVPHKLSETPIGPEGSGAGPPTQIVTQQPQIFSSVGASPSLQRPLKKFYAGEPLALGITQILIGITGMAFGLVMNVASNDFLLYAVIMTPYWTGIPYLISGSLSVAAASNPKKPLVKSMLGLNVVSAIAAGLGIIILSSSLAISGLGSHARYWCRNLDTKLAHRCYETKVIPENILSGMMAVHLAFTILEFCISISTAAFGCKTVCLKTHTETVVVVYQNTILDSANAANLPASGKDAENT